MGSYFRSPEMHSGEGFRCYNCGKKLAIKISGSNYFVMLHCPKCKALISIRMKEPVNWKGESNLPKKEEKNVNNVSSLDSSVNSQSIKESNSKSSMNYLDRELHDNPQSRP